MPTHKKGHDKDKYYYLAKEQGYRSRAAFKLVQINKRFDFLTKARVVVDLCAAPGGWCQVASKFMPIGSLVLGVDLLPIRAIRNVKTIVSDITTAECRKKVTSELQGWKADVVLCDGAPNIGAAYSKDAYVQNELVLAALKTATDHLIKGGTFCTKVYRSVDYNAIIWVLQQLFEDVQAIKPSSSRSQSSEIFLVCLKYTAPNHIDSKLLDPNHVFKEVASDANKKVDILHKKYDLHNKRHRTGYEENVGILLHPKATITEFIKVVDPIRMLTDIHELYFSEECVKFKDNEATSNEIHHFLKDLQVLNKSDFKKLLKWRQLMINQYYPTDVNDNTSKSLTTEKLDKIVTNKSIDEELESLNNQINNNERKVKKKERKLLSKERIRQNLGILNNAFEEINESNELFSLIDATNINKIHSVEFDEMEIIQEDDIDEENDVEVAVGKHHKKEIIEINENDDDLDEQLNDEYQRYILRKSKKSNDEYNKNPNEINDNNRVTPSMKKRKLKNTSEARINDLNQNDNELHIEESTINEIIEQDSDNENENDVMTTDNTNSNSNQWYSHPIFNQTLYQTIKSKESTANDFDETHHNDRQISKEVKDIINLMPKTDKTIRNEKRKKVLERNERKKNKKLKLYNDENENEQNDNNIIIERNINGDGNDSDDENVLSEGELKYRSMISKGMGGSINSNNNDNDNFQVVASNNTEELLEKFDERLYDSDNELYDNNDKTMTLALGTLMLDKTRCKAIIDSSYNRYSWNDQKDLPEWFIDDETRYNKPQIPVPTSLINQVNCF